MIYDAIKTIAISRSAKSLKKNGIMILGAAMVPEMIKGLWLSSTSSIKVLAGVIKHNADAINFLKDLIEKGKYKPVVDRAYSLDKIAEAHAYVEKGHKKGNVAINI